MDFPAYCGTLTFLTLKAGHVVGGAFMPASPIYRPGECIDEPLADKSAARQYIVRLQGMTDLGR